MFEEVLFKWAFCCMFQEIPLYTNNSNQDNCSTSQTRIEPVMNFLTNHEDKVWAGWKGTACAFHRGLVTTACLQHCCVTWKPQRLLDHHHLRHLSCHVYSASFETRKETEIAEEASDANKDSVMTDENPVF